MNSLMIARNVKENLKLNGFTLKPLNQMKKFN